MVRNNNGSSNENSAEKKYYILLVRENHAWTKHTVKPKPLKFTIIKHDGKVDDITHQYIYNLIINNNNNITPIQLNNILTNPKTNDVRIVAIRGKKTKRISVYSQEVSDEERSSFLPKIEVEVEVEPKKKTNETTTTKIKNPWFVYAKFNNKKCNGANNCCKHLFCIQHQNPSNRTIQLDNTTLQWLRSQLKDDHVQPQMSIREFWDRIKAVEKSEIIDYLKQINKEGLHDSNHLNKERKVLIIWKHLLPQIRAATNQRHDKNNNNNKIIQPTNKPRRRSKRKTTI